MPPAGRRPGRSHPARRRRPALLAPLALALAVPLLALPAGAASSPAPAAGPTLEYSNPLSPDVPDDGTVDSCADPAVLRGQQPGDDHWYMYCTTDPLNDEDRNAEGDLVFRKIPMMRSADLVNWTYVGEVADNPAWAAEGSALWAPDVVYSSATDRYYLFATVTNTDDAVSGQPGCGDVPEQGTDSAIGVATSASPTGPWEWSDTPVVAPRRGGEGCNFLWTYDPDVLGDAVGADSTFYFGSYYGGILGAGITFTDSGATLTAAPVQITIPNRYEGANVVERDGWYYLFGSATDCCNGALTGYSVFAGRSRSPLGPFVDREGNSLLDGRVGGTPVISMNGNRWIGTGHNTVFQDAAGQWWTIYHAVDREDPFFTTEVEPGARGFTKRPALLDPLDWVDGWPTVRGGQWASDETMPAPAAQEGQPDRYTTEVVAPEPLGRLTVWDKFDGTTLDPAWTWIRQPAAGTYGVANGAFRFDTQAADLHTDSNNASVLTRPAPKGDYTVETRVRLSVPNDLKAYNFVQGGLVLHGDDDNFIKLVHVAIWETRQTEFAKEIGPVDPGFSRYGNTVVGPPATWTYLRIVVDRLVGVQKREAGGDRERYTAYTSQDGRTWVRGGSWTHTLRDARIGLVSMGGAGFTSQFAYVRVYEHGRVTPPSDRS